MRLSCSTRCLPDQPLDRALSAIRKAGYGAVELSWWQLEDEGYEADACSAILQATLAEYGLNLSGLHMGEITAANPAELRTDLAAVRVRMKTAKALGLEAVSLLGGDRRHQSLEMFAIALEAIMAIAEDMGMNICLANAYNTRVEQIEDLRYLVRAVGHRQFYLLNDTGQFHSAAVNPRNVLAEFADRVALARISDQIGKRTVPIGQGEMNIPAIIEHLVKIGYVGWLVVDQEFGDYADAVNVLTGNRHTLESLLDRYEQDE